MADAYTEAALFVDEAEEVTASFDEAESDAQNNPTQAPLLRAKVRISAFSRFFHITRLSFLACDGRAAAADAAQVRPGAHHRGREPQ